MGCLLQEGKRVALGFLEHCNGDETQDTGLALHLANVSCAEPQKITWYRLVNGTTNPCKGLEMKFLYLSGYDPSIYTFWVQPSPFSWQQISGGTVKAIGQIPFPLLPSCPRQPLTMGWATLFWTLLPNGGLGHSLLFQKGLVLLAKQATKPSKLWFRTEWENYCSTPVT